jgi:hypothetical protein
MRKYWASEAMVLGYWMNEECIVLKEEVMVKGAQCFQIGSTRTMAR